MPVSPTVRRRILDAVLAAERDPSTDLSVALLAEHAGISAKHFQRCFREVVGESPKSYVRRIRLQSAAYLLKWSDAPITNVAMHAGFNTHAGFTKAFQKFYSQSPLEFRQSRDVVPYLHSREQESEALEVVDLAASRLVVRLKQLPAWRVAAMRHVGPVEKTAEIWPRMIDWARQRELLTPQSIFLGIHNDYWDANAEDKYRYDAALVVPDGFRGDNEINTFTIPGGQVAMVEFSGSLAEADRAWRRFVDQWLPVSGFQFRTRFAFDCYPTKLVTGGLLQGILTTLTGIRATFCLPVLE